METYWNSFKYTLSFKVPVAVGSWVGKKKILSSAYLVLAKENEQNMLNISKLTKVSA